MGGTELNYGVDDEFVAEVNAVSNAGEECRAGNFNMTKGQLRTNGTDEERDHTHGDERKLPDAGRDREIVFAQSQTINNCRQAGQPKPRGEIHQPFPQGGPEFLKRGQYHAEDKWIEPGPGRIVNELLKSREGDAGFARIQISERA